MTSFHKYIDNKENLLLIIKLKNGLFLAAFSSIPLINNVTTYYREKRGMLLCLDHKKCFKLKNTQDATPVMYDDYFLVFGNKELKIRILDNKVSSTFGSDFGFFDNCGHDNTKILFGEA